MSELIEVKCINIISNETFSILLKIYENEDEDIISIETEYNNKKYFSDGEFYFEVFQSFKDALLNDNIGIQCYGSLKNAYASNMMKYVPKVYLLKMGEQAKNENIVNIFDYTDTLEIVSKKEQEEYYNIWVTTLNKYIFFYKTKDAFSQWYPSNFKINNRSFNCAEQWMMYSKALVFKDEETASLILEAKEPRRQKELGRKVKNFIEDIWSQNAKKIVYEGNFAKFSQNEDLKELLLKTGDKILVEASPTDVIWGVGLSVDDPDIFDRNKWKGTNYLGEILMKVRDNLKNEENL